jgi:hypothetical protein
MAACRAKRRCHLDVAEGSLAQPEHVGDGVGTVAIATAPLEGRAVGTVLAQGQAANCAP